MKRRGINALQESLWDPEPTEGPLVEVENTGTVS